MTFGLYTIVIVIDLKIIWIYCISFFNKTCEMMMIGIGTRFKGSNLNGFL